MGESDDQDCTTDTGGGTHRRGARRARAVGAPPELGTGLATRCRITLVAAEGEQNKGIAARLGRNPNTVGKWRQVSEAGIDGLHDEPRFRSAAKDHRC